LEILQAKKIIVHQLNIPLVMLFWAVFYPFIYKKLMWIIWGGDLYYYFEEKVSIKDKVMEKVRCHFIKRVRFISSYIKGDYELCKDLYHTKAKYFKSWYPYTIDEKVINAVHVERQSTGTKTLVIGNSADPGNYHLEILEKLLKYKDENIKIYIILSYGGTKDYVDKVVYYAEIIFGAKVECITKYLAFDDYVQLLRNTDICIFNHNRQQGLGNINLMLAIQKKVYIRRIATPYQYFNDLGIKIYDTDAIGDISFDELISVSDKELKSNKDLIVEDLNIENINENWKAIVYGSW